MVQLSSSVSLLRYLEAYIVIVYCLSKYFVDFILLCNKTISQALAQSTNCWTGGQIDILMPSCIPLECGMISLQTGRVLTLDFDILKTENRLYIYCQLTFPEFVLDSSSQVNTYIYAVKHVKRPPVLH